MYKRLFYKLLVFALSILLYENIFTQQIDPQLYEQGQVFVKLRPGQERGWNYQGKKNRKMHPWIQETLKKYQIQTVTCPFILPNPQLQAIRLVKFQANDLTEELIRELEALSFVEYAERVPHYQSLYTPDDLHPNQWNLPKIHAENAWDINTGSSSVVVAIVDDAIRLDHEDLQPNIWENTGEIPGNGLDDDLNGFVDDYNGYDVADNDPNPNPPFFSNTSFTHGTHCAGIASAATDNTLGIASIGFNVRIMAVKIKIDASVGPGLQAGYQGVEYAIAAEADIISMSWGGASPSATYQTIMDIANANGIVLVAAAGNSNTSAPMYPASYTHVISVGASDINDNKASFSNFGPTIDVMAPGVDIWSSLNGSISSYDYNSGTSMACPLVSGLAGLMLTQDPMLSPEDLEDCLESTCDDIDALNPGFAGMLGAGRINAYEALRCIKPIAANFEANFTQVCPGGSVSFTDLSNNSPVAWEWDFPGGVPNVSTLQNPFITYPSTGTYPVTLTVYNSLGSDVLTQTAYITVALPTATLSGTVSILTGFPALLPLTLTGVPPWEITYTDGISSWTESGISSSPWYLTVTPADTAIYSLVSVSDANCSGNTSGSSSVNIIHSSSSNGCDQTTFQWRYGGVMNEEGHCIRATPDGGFVLAGKTASFGAGVTDFLVIKTDSSGMEEWAHTYGSGTEETGFSIAISLTDDGGYVLTGGTTPSARNLVILKLDGLGNVSWQKTIGEPIGNEHGRDILQTSDGGYIIIGTAHSYGAGSSEGYVVKLDAAANLEWTKVFGGTSADHFTDVIEMPGGGFLVGASSRTYGLGNNSAWLMRLDEVGSLLWTKIYDGSSEDGFVDMELTSDGGLICVGITESWGAGGWDAFLVKTDTLGNLQWAKTYGGSGFDRGICVKETDDGGYAFSVQTESFGFGGSDLMLIKTDGMGNLIWAKAYGGTSDEAQSVWGDGMTLTSDGGYALIGSSESFSVGGADLWLVKADACGNSPCHSMDVTPSVSSPIPAVSSPSPGISSGGTLSTLFLVESAPLLIDSLLCEEIPPPFDPCVLGANFEAATVCVGDSTYFSDLSIDTSATVIFWKWLFGDGDSLVGVQNPAHLYAVPGTYTVTLIVGNDGIPMCMDTISIDITISDHFNIEAGPDLVICEGDSIQLEVAIICEDTPYTYSWTPTSGLDDPTSPTPVASPALTTNYIVTVTGGSGTSVSDTIQLVVDASCCVSHPVIIASDSFLCEGESVVFSNLSLVQPGAVFTWSFGPGASPASFVGANPPPVLFPTAGAYTITMSVTDVCGTYSTDLPLYVFSIPDVFAGNDTVICFPETLSLGGPGIAGNQYEWSPTTGLSAPSLSDPEAVVEGEIEYILTVTDYFTGCFAFDTVQISTFPLPEFVLGVDTFMCHGDSLWIEPVIASNNFIWQDGSSGNGYLATDTGYYWVTASTECATVTDSIHISYVDPPEPELGPDTLFCEGDNVVLSPGGGFFTYLWSEGSVGQDLLVIYAGEYGVTVWDEWGCYGSDTILVFTENCDERLFVPTGFSPNGDGLNDGFAPVELGVKVRDFFVFNRWGQMVFYDQNALPGWDGLFFGKAVPEGVYVWKIQFSGRSEEIMLMQGTVTVVR